MESFDSILVRLKGNTCKGNREAQEKFRFHTGSIKRGQRVLHRRG